MRLLKAARALAIVALVYQREKLKYAPREYHIDDEPVPEGTPVDYRYQLELLLLRSNAEQERNDRVDGKISALVAGTIAAIGFTLENLGSGFGILAAVVLLWPLFKLLNAYKALDWQGSPNPELFEASFPRYPKTLLREYAGAIVDNLKINTAQINAKADRYDEGLKALKFAIVAVVVLKLLDFLNASYGAQVIKYVEQRSKPAVTAKPSAAAAARTGATNAREPRANTPEGGRNATPQQRVTRNAHARDFSSHQCDSRRVPVNGSGRIGRTGQ